MATGKTHLILFLSLAGNLAVILAAAYTVYARGGWGYLRGRVHVNETAERDAQQYLQRQTLFELLRPPQNPVVFLGDSLTANCEWGEFFPGAINRGIGGDTSPGVIKRLDSVTRLHPRAVFLMIGSNDLLDLGLSPQQTVANIRAAVAEIRRSSPETTVYVESNLPTRVPRKNAHSRGVNAELKSLADGGNVIYLDLYNLFLEGDQLAPRFTYDGNHLNGAGYAVWKRAIEKYVPQPGLP